MVNSAASNEVAFNGFPLSYSWPEFLWNARPNDLDNTGFWRDSDCADKTGSVDVRRPQAYRTHQSDTNGASPQPDEACLTKG
jgi:hypothetical protein